jgi:branched-subunit amino acid ABC-type transport system permease component
MADLLTHVLVAYALLTVASWRVDRLTRPWIVVGMAGAAIPDLVKVGIVVDRSVIESLLGVPFSYAPISSIGGVLVIAGAIALCFGDRYRRRAFGYLVAGGGLSLVLDGLRAYADGQAGFWLYPIWWRPPTPSLYVTSDPRVTVVALVVSAAVFLVDRYLQSA